MKHRSASGIPRAVACLTQAISHFHPAKSLQAWRPACPTRGAAPRARQPSRWLAARSQRRPLPSPASRLRLLPDSGARAPHKRRRRCARSRACHRRSAGCCARKQRGGIRVRIGRCKIDDLRTGIGTEEVRDVEFAFGRLAAEPRRQRAALAW